MIKFAKKMPITVILLGFSYLIAAGGFGWGSLWMIFNFKEPGYFIYGFLILAGSLLLSALIRMVAVIGQIVFDARVDNQNSFRQLNKLDQDLKAQLQRQADTLNQNLGRFHSEAGKLDRELNADLLKLDRELNADLLKLDRELSQELKTQLQRQADTLSQKFEQSSQEARKLDQELNQDLKIQLQIQADILNLNFSDIIGKFDQSSREAKELIQHLIAIKDNFDRMNCDSKDINQNIQQIKTFFEQIEKHLDLKK